MFSDGFKIPLRWMLLLIIIIIFFSVIYIKKNNLSKRKTYKKKKKRETKTKTGPVLELVYLEVTGNLSMFGSGEAQTCIISVYLCSVLKHSVTQ